MALCGVLKNGQTLEDFKLKKQKQAESRAIV
jgi:hypothetical protein